MKQDRLEKLFNERDAWESGMEFEGICHDCKKSVQVVVDATETGFEISGGAIYEPEPDAIYLKCDPCFKRKGWLTGWKKCEVYSRIVGYMRPLSQWNKAKADEYERRKMFKIA